MHGNDPFLALLGFFILSTTFFFCSEVAVIPPSPVTLEQPAEVPSSAPNITEPLPSPQPAPPASMPAVLNKSIDDLLIESTMMVSVNSVMLLPEGNSVWNHAATMRQDAPTVVFAAGGQTDNVGPAYVKQGFSEHRAKVVGESLASKENTTSGNWKCWFWMVAGASFLGWGIKGVVMGPEVEEKRREVERLLSKVTLLTNRPPEVRTVEKRVEVPVERVVLKRVEVPVEKVVDRLIDNPEQVARIKALEDEVAMIAELRAQIAQLQAVSAQIAVRSTEEPVVVPVDNPEQLARIKALEDEVAVIAELRAQIAQLQAASAQAGEASVEKQIEPPAEPSVVKNGDVSVDTVSAHAGDLDSAGAVERTDDGPAVGESPDDLKHIRGVGPALERFLHKRGVFWFSQVATWNQADIDKFEFLLPNFGGRIQRENWVRSAKVEHYKKYKKWLGNDEPPGECLDLPVQIAQLQAASVQAGEASVEKQIEPPAEPSVVKNGDVSVDTVSAHAGDLDSASAVERTSFAVSPFMPNPDSAGAVERTDDGPAVGESPDDLKHIRGVGPALERFLHKRGVFWFSQVATWNQADIDKFEFLLPNFGGRIQRENWVRSAKVEHYKKYKKWLGNDEPPSTTVDGP